MSLEIKVSPLQAGRFPRLRGDEPPAEYDAFAATLFSPPTRG